MANMVEIGPTLKRFKEDELDPAAEAGLIEDVSGVIAENVFPYDLDTADGEANIHAWSAIERIMIDRPDFVDELEIAQIEDYLATMGIIHAIQERHYWEAVMGIGGDNG